MTLSKEFKSKAMEGEGITADDQTCHLIEESASKSLRLSAMLIDSSIRGSFFCGDTSRWNSFQSSVENFA